MQHQSALAFAFLLLAGGCDKSASRAPAPSTPSAALVPAAPPAPPDAAVATPTVATHMQEHFAKAAEMRTAVINGDLDGYKKVAAWMAEHELAKDPPETWQTHLDAMQSCAKRGRDAADLAAASLALGEVGRTCSECHSALGAPKITVGAPPAEGSGAQLRMIRHQWAADRMWEGLMAPSDDAWVKGAEVFSDAPLTPEEVTTGKSVSPDVKKLAKAAQDIAHKARTIDKSKRHEAYAELLTTCQRCHTETK